jgi:hypothetical protein
MKSIGNQGGKRDGGWGLGISDEGKKKEEIRVSLLVSSL